MMGFHLQRTWRGLVLHIGRLHASFYLALRRVRVWQVSASEPMPGTPCLRSTSTLWVATASGATTVGSKEP